MDIPVVTGPLSFWIFLAGFALTGLWVLGARAVKRRKLGKVLWTSPLPPQRWLAVIWLVLAGLRIMDVATGSAMRHMGLDILGVGVYLFCAFITVFGSSLVSVHEGGVCIGLLCFSWREVTGWSWRPGTEPGDVLLLSIQGRDRRGLGLRVWTSSRWRLIYELRRQWPIGTRIARDGDLEALLRKYAPQAERPSMVAVSTSG